MAIDVGSSWWIQTLLWIAVNLTFYGLIELWRHFPFISSYIVIFFNFGLMPFVFITDHTSFFFIKYFLISPVLVVITLWRVTYIPNISEENNSPIWKIWISKLARYLAKYLCCVKTETLDQAVSKNPNPNTNRQYSNKSVANTTPCMEYFLFLVGFSNILVAAVFGFFDNNYTNSIAGIILAFTLPIPNKLLYKKHGYYVGDSDDNKDGGLYDGCGPIGAVWILAFTSWEWCYVWHYAPESVFVAAFHLLPNGFRAFYQKRYDLWLQLRVFCLCIALWCITPVELTSNPSTDWLLNAGNFPWFIEVEKNHAYVFEIWGAFTLVLVLIYVVLWVKWILEQRKLDSVNDTEVQMNEHQKDKNAGDKQTADTGYAVSI